MKALRSVTRPYVDGVGLYSLRRETQLEATLQVSRFSKSAKTESAALSRLGHPPANSRFWSGT